MNGGGKKGRESGKVCGSGNEREEESGLDGLDELNVIYMNAHSINNKMDKLKGVVEACRPDIVAITESWTNEKTHSERIQIDGFEIVARCDREDTAGGRGGILVYARKGVNDWNEEVDTEFNQCTEIKIKRRAQVMSYVIYRSPNSTRENNDALNELIRSMKSESIIIGDLNFPGIDWRSRKSDAKGRGFYEACEDKCIKQFVEEPTHINGNFLDLVLCGEEELIGEVETEGRLGPSDLEILSLTIKGKAKMGGKQEWFRDFHRAKYDEMQIEMAKDWDSDFNGKGVNDMWLTIKGAILDAIERHVPMRRRKKRNFWAVDGQRDTGDDKGEEKEVERIEREKDGVKEAGIQESRNRDEKENKEQKEGL